MWDSLVGLFFFKRGIVFPYFLGWIVIFFQTWVVGRFFLFFIFFIFLSTLTILWGVNNQ